MRTKGRRSSRCSRTASSSTTGCSTASPRKPRRPTRSCTWSTASHCSSDATSPTSGHCSRATGRGRSSNPHRRAGDRGGVRRLMRLLPLLLGLSVLEGDGGWSAAAPLPEPIQELSAAVLHGKIYVAGGIDRAGQATAAAFRYDPAANHWERIADLPVPRHHMPLAVVGDTLYAVGGL